VPIFCSRRCEWEERPLRNGSLFNGQSRPPSPLFLLRRVRARGSPEGLTLTPNLPLSLRLGVNVKRDP